MRRCRSSLAATLFALLLTACGGGGGSPVAPGGPSATDALAPMAKSTTVTATRNGKPVPSLVVKLTRDKENGPVIARATTKANGKVVFSGFTATQIVCASGSLKVSARITATSSYCAKPFPANVYLDFST